MLSRKPWEPHSMSSSIYDLTAISGNEAMSFSERLSSLFKEVSVGIDAINAKSFNKSIHTLKNIEVWKKLADNNAYFSASSKHIPSPVFFNATKITFREYVEYVMNAVPILKLADTQAQFLYTALKTTAIKGRVPFNITASEPLVMVNQALVEFNNYVADTGVYTRPVSEMFPNFKDAYELFKNFNDVVDTLKSRDAEVLSKRSDELVRMIKIIKQKTASGEIIFQEKEAELLNAAINEMASTVTFAGKMLGVLAELTRVMQLQIDESRKL